METSNLLSVSVNFVTVPFDKENKYLQESSFSSLMFNIFILLSGNFPFPPHLPHPSIVSPLYLPWFISKGITEDQDGLWRWMIWKGTWQTHREWEKHRRRGLYKNISGGKKAYKGPGHRFWFMKGVGVPTPPSNSLTSAGCPMIQLNSNTIYLEIASHPTG